MNNITLFGQGNMAQAIASRLQKTNQSYTFVSAKDTVTSLGDLVFLAVPFGAVTSIVAKYRDLLKGKVVVDITNPVDFTSMDGLVVDADSSATELIAQMLPDSKLVKAFNTNFAGTLASDEAITVLMASDDDHAKERLIQAFDGSGLVMMDAGTLKRARELEAIGFLQITLAIREQLGWTGGFRLIK
jgi:8-hydroxy-5-deazaflavin:NADPH oxidoreductase